MTTTRTSVQQSAKLQVPLAEADQIERARLHHRLDALVTPGGGTCVVAVCAPAGFGKTTAVSAWVRSLDQRRTPVAWCSLDATDSHTFRFWSLVLRSVIVARPELSDAGLAAPHRAGADRFFEDLVAALADEPLVLVLENLHEVVDPHLLADLDRFVAMLPATVRLVLTSRSDPPLTALMGLHLRGRAAQLRVDELAFTHDELRRLVPGLDEQSRVLIWERTEGWPALVQLMLLSLRTHSELPLTPYGGDPVLAEYLFHELLRRQEPHVQKLMLVAGVPDLLPLDLAVELSDMTDAGTILDRLVRGSGLVTRTAAPPGEQPWYRFHPLLRAYLQAELTRSDRQHEREVQTQAARWFLRAGFPLEAVHHARASEDPAMVEQVSAAVGLSLVNAGESSLLLDALTGTTPRQPMAGPWTHVVTAAALSDLGRIPEALGELALVDPASEPDPDLEDARRAVDLRLRRSRGLPLPSGPQPAPSATSLPDVRLYAEVQRGAVLLWGGQVAAAVESLLAARDLAEALARPAAQVDTLVLLALARAAASDYPGIVPHLERALAIADQHGWGASPRLAHAHLMLAWRARLRLEDGRARQHATRTQALIDVTADPAVAASATILEAIFAFEADPSDVAAAHHLHEVCNRFESGGMPVLMLQATLVDARFSLILHRVERVRETMDVVRRSVGECGERALIGAMLESAGGRRRQALDQVRRVTSGELEVVAPVTVLLAASFETQLALLEGDTYGATKAARRSLELAERFDTPRAIVDFGGEPMLALLLHERGRWGTHEDLAERITGTTLRPEPPPEVLTTREREVLVELPSLRTVDEIARSMFVSVNTLKTHLRSVYRKLGVSTRREAVAAARHRGLL